MLINNLGAQTGEPIKPAPLNKVNSTCITDLNEALEKKINEDRLDLVQLKSRKMTMQAPLPSQNEEQTPKEGTRVGVSAERKNTISAFVPIKDNVSKKSMDETSMFLRNSCIKPEQALSNGNMEIQGFAFPMVNFTGRRESDMGGVTYLN